MANLEIIYGIWIRNGIVSERVAFRGLFIRAEFRGYLRLVFRLRPQELAKGSVRREKLFARTSGLAA